MKASHIFLLFLMSANMVNYTVALGESKNPLKEEMFHDAAFALRQKYANTTPSPESRREIASFIHDLYRDYIGADPIGNKYFDEYVEFARDMGIHHTHITFLENVRDSKNPLEGMNAEEAACCGYGGSGQGTPNYCPSCWD